MGSQNSRSHCLLRGQSWPKWTLKLSSVSHPGRLKHAEISSVDQRSGWWTASALTFAAGVAAGVAFLVNLLAARTLGPSLRGEVAFVLQLSYFLAPILLLGADKAIIRRNSDDRRSEGLFVPGPPFLLLATVSTTLALAWVFKDWRAMAGPLGAVIAWFSLRRANAVRVRNIGRYLWPFATYQAVILAGSTILFLRGVDEWQAWALVYLCAIPLLCWAPAPPVNLRAASRLRMNAGLTVASVTHLFSLRGERLLMPLLSTNSQLGLYVVVATATEPLYWCAQALADHRTGSVKNGESVFERIRRTLQEMLVVSLVAGLGGLAIWLLVVPAFGETFRSARALVLPLIIASILLYAYRQFASWTLASAFPARTAYIEGGVAASAAVLYPVSIMNGAALGAAWGCVAVYAIGIALSLVVFSSCDAKEL